MNKFDMKIPEAILWTADGFHIGKLLDEQAQTIKVLREAVIAHIEAKVEIRTRLQKENKELRVEMRKTRKNAELRVSELAERNASLAQELFELSGESNGEIDFNNKNAPGE